MPASAAATALARFGLGGRPDEPPPAAPRRWLLDQLDRYEARPVTLAALTDPGPVLQRDRDRTRALRQTADATATTPGATPDPALRAARDALRHEAQSLYQDAVRARVQVALDTPTPFVERLVAFWSNHFCISADNPQVAAFAGAFERDAIRPHVLGRFPDMLLAVERHPAMLAYLNQAGSIGPDSPAARRAALRDPGHPHGLNENLAREIMELHTLGARSGYDQADVTEFARALTGWTTGGEGDPDGFAFRSPRHEPGGRTILGRRYDQDGAGQAAAILADFAQSPATATHVASKLARHFAGDTPPPPLVARLAGRFAATGGDLPDLYRTLVDSPEPWSPAALRFRTPWDWLVAALRGLGCRDAGALPVGAMLAQAGQPVWRPGSPAGWDDTTAAWAAPDALLQRVRLAARLAAPFGDRIDARVLAPRLLPGALSPATAQQVARAESPGSALALLLVSPEFLRR